MSAATSTLVARGVPDAGTPAAGPSYQERLRRSADWPSAPRGLADRVRRLFDRSSVRYGLVGFATFFALWYLLTAVVVPPRFNFIPNPIELFSEWVSRDPKFGISLFTPQYYEHIWISTLRVYIAFVISVLLGAPLGILIGWNKTARNIILPVVEILRPIPPLAWVPLAVLMIPATEGAVIFITLLASFFATVLNTLLGVLSIDSNYFRAASCLGYSRWQVLRRVVVPGSLPYIFTGLQIAMGVAWFSLVGGELIAGRSGLGYLIFDAYTQLALPNIFIGMITLGVLGWISSALIRMLGDWLMDWNRKDKGDRA